MSEVRYSGRGIYHFEGVVSGAVEENKTGCYALPVNKHDFQNLEAFKGRLSRDC